MFTPTIWSRWPISAALRCVAAIIATSRLCASSAWNPPRVPAFISTTLLTKSTDSSKSCARSSSSLPLEVPDMTATENITPHSTMAEVLEAYPGAQRALFRRYHIGGCSSCAFQPAETLAQVCQRNNALDVEEVLAHIRTSHEQDAKIFIEP